MQNFLKQFDYFLFAVSKEQVESGDTKMLVNFFQEKLEKHTPEELKNIQGRASLSFNGYDDTPEELYEINEVRAWVRKFINALPSFFYFFDIKIIQLLTYCALDAKKIGVEGKTAYAFVEPDKLLDFVNHYLDIMDKLCKELKFEPEKIKEIQSEILQKFGMGFL